VNSGGAAIAEHLLWSFVSPYALKAPYEDFAETFMTCLWY